MRRYLALTFLLAASIAIAQRPPTAEAAAAQREMQRYQTALAAKDYKKALTIVDGVIKKYPNAEGNLIGFKLDVMWLIPDKQAPGLAYAKEAAEKRFLKNATTLNNIGWSIVISTAKLPATYYKEGVRLAQRSVTVASTGGRTNAPMLPYALDTLAYGYYKLGDYPKAISSGERAVKESGTTPPEVKKEILEHLALFKKAAGLRKA